MSEQTITTQHRCMCRDCGPCGCGKGADGHCATCADRPQITADLAASISKARSRTLMAAKNFSRLMSEFEGELQYCGEAMTEMMDAADQLMALEAMQDAE